jgi:hypothetical protein
MNILDFPVLVQGGGYNTIHRFAMLFLDGPEPKGYAVVAADKVRMF